MRIISDINSSDRDVQKKPKTVTIAQSKKINLIIIFAVP